MISVSAKKPLADGTRWLVESPDESDVRWRPLAARRNSLSGRRDTSRSSWQTQSSTRAEPRRKRPIGVARLDGIFDLATFPSSANDCCFNQLTPLPRWSLLSLELCCTTGGQGRWISVPTICMPQRAIQRREIFAKLADSHVSVCLWVSPIFFRSSWVFHTFAFVRCALHFHFYENNQDWERSRKEQSVNFCKDSSCRSCSITKWKRNLRADDRVCHEFFKFSFVLVEYFKPLCLSDARFTFIFIRLIKDWEISKRTECLLISVKIFFIALVRLRSEREIYEQMIASVMSFSNFLSF